MVLEANNFFWSERYQLPDDGTVDDAARHVFTNGHCHSLALALRAETGWPLVGFFSDPDVDNPDNPPEHVVVQAPSGEYVDVNGPGALERWRDYSDYSDSVPALLQPSRVWRAFPDSAGNRQYRWPSVKKARTFVPAVLETVPDYAAVAA